MDTGPCGIMAGVNTLLSLANSSFNFLIYLSFCMKKKRRRRPTAGDRTSPQGGISAYPTGGANHTVRTPTTMTTSFGGAGGGGVVTRVDHSSSNATQDSSRRPSG